MKPVLLPLAFLTMVLCARSSSQDTVAPAPRRIPPTGLQGRKTPNGIQVFCTRPGNRFSIELAGKAIKPLSPDRLQWDIDGREVELELAAFPPEKSGKAPPEEELLRAYQSWYLEALQAGGWEGRGEPQLFALADASHALSGSLSQNAQGDKIRCFTASLNNTIVLTLTATVPASAEKEALAYLHTALATLKREAPPETAANSEPAAPKFVDINDPNYKGESLDFTSRTLTLLTGEKYTILVNETMMTAKDRLIPNAIPLKPAALLEVTRFVLGAHLDSTVGANVFDGRSAHSINLEELQADTNTIVYWDPWGKGSFLQKANNQAGVDAKPHPTEQRLWLIPADQFQQVQYALNLKQSTTLSLFHFLSMLDGPEAAFLGDLRAIQMNDPTNELLEEGKLRNIAAYIRACKDYKRALSVCKALAVLYPASEKAATDLAQAYTDAGVAAPEKGTVKAYSTETADGDRLAAALQGDFISFFHLKLSAEKKPDEQAGTRVVIFQSPGKFHDLAMLFLTLTKDDRIAERKLLVRRSFIEDRSDSIFARDLAKSFLQASLSEDEVLGVQELLAEIFQQKHAQFSIPGAQGDEAKLPALTSPGYLTFLGKHETYERRFKQRTLTLTNIALDEKAFLMMTVSPNK